MIKPLEEIVLVIQPDGTKVTAPPSKRVMMDKINEIIHYINRNEGSKYEIGVDMASSVDITGFEPRRESRY